MDEAVIAAASDSSEGLARVRRVIVVADLAESVRLMQADESGTIRRWREFVARVDDAILPCWKGRMVKHLGDGFLLEFESTHDAVAASMQLHGIVGACNDGVPEALRFALRVGVHVADVVVDRRDVFGHGVNVAARLVQLADPGETVISSEVNAELVPGLDLPTTDLGECWLKHVAHPVRAYRVGGGGQGAGTVLSAAPGDLHPTLAVLPFQGRDVAWPSALGEVLAEELIGVLSGAPNLHVVSRLSTSLLSTRSCSPAQLAQFLGADFALSGSYRLEGEMLVVRFELASTRDSKLLSTQTLTRPAASLLSAQTPLAEEIAHAAFKGVLEAQIRSARHMPLPNLAGYTMLLGGVALMHRFSRADFDRAKQLLDALIERWPRQSAPRAWEARWRLFRVLQAWSPDVAADHRAARQSADMAIELDPDSSVALSVAGSVQVGLAKDIEGGLALYERALAANPNDSLAWLLRGTAHAFAGRGELAMASTDQAMRLSPLDPLRFLYDCHRAGAALASTRFADARDLALRSLQANALHLSTLRVLAVAQQMLGEDGAARATVNRLLQLDPAQSVSRFLRSAPSADHAVGRMCAAALAAAGLPG